MATAKDILAIAAGEVGVKESPAGSNRVKYNTDYYGRAVSGNAYPWCCVFVWWVFHRAGASALFGDKTASCTNLWWQCKNRGLVVDVKDMAPGDVVFYNWKLGPKAASANHVGIVEKVHADGTFTAIEGNTSMTSDGNGGQVMRRRRSKKVVCAVARPRYKKEDEIMGTNLCWAVLPKKDIKAIRIVLGNGKRAAEIKAETGCDSVINGGLYDMSTGVPLCHLKSDGEVWATDPWGYIGYGWVAGGDIQEVAIPEEGAQLDSYIACCQLLGRHMGEESKPHYPDEMGGKRGRTAMALTADSLILYCSRDGSAYTMTPEALQAKLRGMGATSAVMLDGGGSSQCDFGSLGAVTSYDDRRVHHYICIWTDKDILGRYEVVTKTSPLTIRKRNSTVSGKVGSYAKGAVVDVLAVKNGWARTVKGWCSMQFLKKVSGPKPAPTPEPVPEPTVPETPPTVYNTVAECPQWAQKAVRWAVDSKYIQGDEHGQLGLDATKLWALQVMYNIVGRDK